MGTNTSERIYHYFYRVDNLNNGKFYYGIHSTKNLDDGYMGSGRHLSEDKKKYGKQAFKKEIIKFFDTREEASEYESEFVTEKLVRDCNCYNIKIGGDYGITSGTILVTDSDGIMHRCTKDDERYISGEWFPFMKGRLVCYDKLLKKNVFVSKDVFTGNTDRYSTLFHGYITVKDKDGNTFYVAEDDKRYQNGELVPIWRGRKHSEFTREKMRETHKKNEHQKGERNSQFGTCWVNDGKSNRKIKKEDINTYLLTGWFKGRIVIPSEKYFRTQCKLSKEVIEQKLKNKQTKQSIAKEFNIDRGTLYRFIRRMNLQSA